MESFSIPFFNHQILFKMKIMVKFIFLFSVLVLLTANRPQAQTTAKNPAYVMELYQLFGEGKIPDLLSRLDPNITWDATDNPIVPGSYFTSSEDVAQFFQGLASKAQITGFQPIEAFESGENVFVVGKQSYITTDDGTSHACNWLMHWKFKDGKPYYFKEFFDEHPSLNGKQTGLDFLAAMDASDLEGLKACTSPDFKIIHPNFPQALSLDEFFEMQVKPFNAAFSGLKHSVADFSCEGNKLTMRGIVSGKHVGEVMGIPASKNDINVPWLAFATLDEEGKIRELHVQFNQLVFLAQLGVNPMEKK